MFGLGFFEVLIIVAALLIVVGPDRLPEMATSIAKLIREWKLVFQDIKHKIYEREKPSAPLPPPLKRPDDIDRTPG